MLISSDLILSINLYLIASYLILLYPTPSTTPHLIPSYAISARHHAPLQSTSHCASHLISPHPISSIPLYPAPPPPYPAPPTPRPTHFPSHSSFPPPPPPHPLLIPAPSLPHPLPLPAPSPPPPTPPHDQEPPRTHSMTKRSALQPLRGKKL